MRNCIFIRLKWILPGKKPKRATRKKNMDKNFEYIFAMVSTFLFFLNYNDDVYNHFNLTLIHQLMHFHLIFQLFLANYFSWSKKSAILTLLLKLITLYAAKLLFSSHFLCGSGCWIVSKKSHMWQFWGRRMRAEIIWTRLESL